MKQKKVEVCVLPGCGHEFHKECLDDWFFFPKTVCESSMQNSKKPALGRTIADERERKKRKREIVGGEAEGTHTVSEPEKKKTKW